MTMLHVLYSSLPKKDGTLYRNASQQLSFKNFLADALSSGLWFKQCVYLAVDPTVSDAVVNEVSAYLAVGRS